MPRGEWKTREIRDRNLRPSTEVVARARRATRHLAPLVALPPRWPLPLGVGGGAHSRPHRTPRAQSSGLPVRRRTRAASPAGRRLSTPARAGPRESRLTYSYT